MSRFLKTINCRIVILFLIIIFQILFIMLAVSALASYSIWILYFFKVAGIITVIYIVNRNENPSFALTWCVIIMFFSNSGWILYWFSEKNRLLCCMTRRRRSDAVLRPLQASLPDSIYAQIKCIYSISGAVICNNTNTKFYPCGEDFYTDFLFDLNKAEEYVFLEYFIISEGHMWRDVYNILKDKANKGIKIYILYDDMCSKVFNLSLKRECKVLGICCEPFNPVRPSVDTSINYRDHRKITVIDGKIAYTGGINIADEYINITQPFGYWKDSVIKINGDAAQQMALMFTDMWNNYTSGAKITVSEYKRSKYCNTCSGIVQVFGNNPDSECAKISYIRMINYATRYIYITTPYFIPDYETISALRIAAQSGIDVRIITPSVPDKWYVHSVTRVNYKALLNYGVKIYEYNPGFIHSKTIVSDDISALIGTANFDFRSFYLLFENSIFLYDTPAVKEMKNDFESTLRKCTEITAENYHFLPLRDRFFGILLKIFSPLM